MLSRGVSWTEKEIKDTVRAYFELLDSQNNKVDVPKIDIYKKLNRMYSNRSIKAFEAKFQNISAILYELNQLYCDGLKPRFNYQNLLKLIVLDYLKRNPQPQVEPYEILLGKMQKLARNKKIPVSANGAGRFGLSIENQLGIQANSNKEPDFMGIELKTKVGKSKQTLFSRTPCHYFVEDNKEGLMRKYSYWDDAKKRNALYTSFNSSEDSLGFKLYCEKDFINIYNKDSKVLGYAYEKIEEALLSKHSQSMFIELEINKKDDIETFRIKKATFCKWPSILKFIKFIEEGKIFLDFTISEENGKFKDHGFLWKIEKENIEDLFLFSKKVELK